MTEYRNFTGRHYLRPNDNISDRGLRAKDFRDFKAKQRGSDQLRDALLQFFERRAQG